MTTYGSYDLLTNTDERIYAFTRSLDDDRLLVILNFSSESPVFDLPEGISYGRAELLIGNYNIDPADTIRRIMLRPYEARVYRLM